jgi:hypothetical protein
MDKQQFINLLKQNIADLIQLEPMYNRLNVSPATLIENNRKLIDNMYNPDDYEYALYQILDIIDTQLSDCVDGSLYK